MKFILLIVALFKLISSAKLRRGYYYTDYETNKIYNHADANAHGVAVNLGHYGFAQANPTAYAGNTNVIY